ncbi:Antitoxin HigA [Pigmentiphaga humi]|uniref:Antitoxin HigA n=2 Tax=Pigmentiphaga humi TaxID=2478468 RepID=A0A3P4B8A3_9BURK|nr:Antitoxin HigA [Pigmentiphaga humi]
MSDLEKLKRHLLADPKVKAEYEAQAPEFALARELIAARVRAGLTQDEVAERMQTTQSTIARLESGRSMPSMRTLARFAEATGARVAVRLESPQVKRGKRLAAA